MSSGGGIEPPSAMASASTLRQQLEHERRLRQQAEGRGRELKLDNEKCTIRFHELQRNFEGIQAQLRQMVPSQKKVEQLVAEKAALQKRMDEKCEQYDSRLQLLVEERDELSRQLKAGGAVATPTASSDSLVHELQEENDQLRAELSTKQEKYDKTLNEITSEIVSTLTKYKTASQEKRDLQSKYEQQRQYAVSLERKNQTLLKLLCRIKSKQAALPATMAEDDGTEGSEYDLLHNGNVLGKGSSLVNLESETVPRHVNHLPTRSASLRSAVHPLRRQGLRRSASGELNPSDDNTTSDLSTSEYNISNRNDATSLTSLLSSTSDVQGMSQFQRHRLLHSSQSRPSETAIHEQSSGESRPPSMPDLNLVPGYHPSRLSKTPDSLLLPSSSMGSRTAALSVTSLTKLEGQLSRCTNRSIDSVTAEHLRRMKKDGVIAAQIKTHSNGSHALPATPSPPNRGSLIESESSEEEEDHINFVEMWKQRSAGPAGSKLGAKARPLSTVDTTAASRQAIAEGKTTDPKTSSLPRNVSLSTAAASQGINLQGLGSPGRVLPGKGQNGKSTPVGGVPDKEGNATKPPEIAASARAILLDNMVLSHADTSETSPPLSPGRVPSLAEAKDYLRCLRRKNINNEKPFRGPMTIIQFYNKNYYNRFAAPEQAAIDRFDFLETFQFAEPGSMKVQPEPPASRPNPRSQPTRTSTKSITGSPKVAPKTPKVGVEKKPISSKPRASTPTSARSSTPTGSTSRSPANTSAEKKQSSLVTRRSNSGSSIGSGGPPATPGTSARAGSPQVAEKKRAAPAVSVNLATRTKSSASPVTLSKTSPKMLASKTSSSPLRTTSSGTNTSSKSTSPSSSAKSSSLPSSKSTSSSSGRRLGALLGHHGTSGSKSSTDSKTTSSKSKK